ncbi:MAG: hypothetical protein MZV64_24220 [Ignavibacteriales bacterium]|nr:hypothetical protein [Ignavibacteriales bacterium]
METVHTIQSVAGGPKVSRPWFCPRKGNGAAEREVNTNVDVPAWFYLLPIIWLILLIETYEPHVAGSGRKTSRGVAIAAFIGLIAFSLLIYYPAEYEICRAWVWEVFSSLPPS